MDFEEQILFGKKSFGGLLKNIYENQQEKSKQIMDMIMALKPFISSPGDAVLIVPLIKEYLEIGVKNDEQLVKMAAIVQRAMGSASSGAQDEFNLTEADREALLAEVKQLGTQQEQIPAPTPTESAKYKR